MFGGAIRDLAVHGNDEFPSDVDIVLEAADEQRLLSRMTELKAQRNRFGGFRFSTSRWKFDVWRLEDTWALRQGYVTGTSAEALLRSTFFDWDAVAYDFSTRRLIMLDGYFERLQRGVVDINLEPNPNPRGNAERALRLYWNGNVALAPKLAEFVAAFAGDFGAHRNGYPETLLPEVLPKFLADFHRSRGQPVRRRIEQLALA